MPQNHPTVDQPSRDARATDVCEAGWVQLATTVSLFQRIMADLVIARFDFLKGYNYGMYERFTLVHDEGEPVEFIDWLRGVDTTRRTLLEPSDVTNVLRTLSARVAGFNASVAYHMSAVLNLLDDDPRFKDTPLRLKLGDLRIVVTVV